MVCVYLPKQLKKGIGSYAFGIWKKECSLVFQFFEILLKNLGCLATLVIKQSAN